MRDLFIKKKTTKFFLKVDVIIWGSKTVGGLHAGGEEQRWTGRLGGGALGTLTGQTVCDIKHCAATQEAHPPSKCL